MFDPPLEQIVSWFGVEQRHLTTVLPNRGNFGECACTGACDPNGINAHIFTSGQAINEAMCAAAGGVWTSTLVSGLFADDNAASSTAQSMPPPPSPPPAITDPSQCPSGCCAVLYAGAPGEVCRPVPIWDFSTWSHPGGPGVTTASNGLCGAIKFNWWQKSGGHTGHDPSHSTWTNNGGLTKVGDYVDTNCGSGR